MPTPTKGPRLGGSPAHERLIMANLATALFQHGRITTTATKAKRLRPLAERLVTFAKRGDLHSRRQVLTVGGDSGVAPFPQDHGPTTTAKENTARNTGNIRAMRAIRNGAGRPCTCISDWVITRPLSTKNTFTAAPPCDTASCSQFGRMAKGATWPSMT